MTSKARHITSDKLNSFLFEAFDDDAPIFSTYVYIRMQHKLEAWPALAQS